MTQFTKYIRWIKKYPSSSKNKHRYYNINIAIEIMINLKIGLYLFFMGHGFFASITSSRMSESRCIGSLTIGHEDEDRAVKYINLHGVRTHYPNLRRGFPIIRRHIISSVEVVGNCCWELYPDRMFKGSRQSIFPGGGWIHPNFQVVSIKKMECWILWNSILIRLKRLKYDPDGEWNVKFTLNLSTTVHI